MYLVFYILCALAFIPEVFNEKRYHMFLLIMLVAYLDDMLARR